MREPPLPGAGSSGLPDDPRALRRGLVRGLASSALGLGAVLLAIVVVSSTDLGRGAIQDLLERARWEWIALATLLMSAAFVFMGLRWRSLMPPGVRASTLGLTAMLLGGLLLNYAFPGPVGELGAAWFAHRRYRLPLSDALASGVAARVVGLATSALLAMGIWLSCDLPVPAGYERWLTASALLIGAGGATLALLAAKPQIWQALATRTLGWIGRAPALRGPAERAHRMVTSLTSALAAVVLRGPGAYARAVLWAVAGHLTVSVGIGTAAWAFGVMPDPAGLVFTYTLSTAGAVLMFALPGSQLTWDAAFTALLVGACGLALSDALAVAAVVRLQQVGLQAVGGLCIGWLLASPGAPPTPPVGSPEPGPAPESSS